MRVHSRLLPDVLVQHTKLPRPRVEQTLRQVKAASRISTGRPFAPPLTSRDIARILIALSAPSPSRAVDHERQIGRLVAEDGASVECAIIEVIEGGQSAGQIAIGQSFVEVRTTCGTRTFGTLGDGLTTFVILPISAAAAIGRELINK